MSAEIQTTLLGESYLSLDTTCSEKKVFPSFASVRIDIRREANPDIQASAEFLPFRDRAFGKLYCDPPHMINPKPWEKPTMGAHFASVNRKLYPHQHFLNCIGRFGYWTSRERWYEFLEKTNAEFARVLSTDGVLEYKLCETKAKSVRFSDLERMRNFLIVAVKDAVSKFGHNPTRYFTMRLRREMIPLTCLCRADRLTYRYTFVCQYHEFNGVKIGDLIPKTNIEFYERQKRRASKQ